LNELLSNRRIPGEIQSRITRLPMSDEEFDTSYKSNRQNDDNTNSEDVSFSFRFWFSLIN
jgi:hypothetical protein